MNVWYVVLKYTKYCLQFDCFVFLLARYKTRPSQSLTMQHLILRDGHNGPNKLLRSGVTLICLNHSEIKFSTLFYLSILMSFVVKKINIINNKLTIWSYRKLFKMNVLQMNSRSPVLKCLPYKHFRTGLRYTCWDDPLPIVF